MDIKRVNKDNRIIFELNGRMDKFTVPLLEKEIFEIMEVLEKEIIEINMSGVTYLSSAGLRILLNTHKETNGRLVVSHVRKEISEIFEITGFNNVLTVE